MSTAAPENKTSALMRRMGSESGRWNPLPPEQHLFPVLHPAIVLNRTESLLLAWIQLKTVDRFKGEDHPQERTEQAHDSRGDLTLTDAAEDLDIDLSNLLKAADTLTGYGFISRDKKGVLYLCAGGLNIDGRTESEAKETSGLYKLVPEYLHAHIKGLSENGRREFFQGWLGADKWGDAAHAQAKVAIYQEVIERKKKVCEKIGAELKTGGGRPRQKAPDGENPTPQIVQLTFVLGPDSEQFVRTSWHESEQTSSTGSYEAKGDFVPGDATFYSSRVSSESGELAKNAPEGGEGKPSSKPAEAVATKTPEVDPQVAQRIDEQIEYRIAAAGLHSLGGKPLDAQTVRNIRTHLLRLPGPVETKQILALVEDKCRHLARHPEQAAEKTWGWVVAVVKGEVNRIAGEPAADFDKQFHDALNKKGMR